MNSRTRIARELVRIAKILVAYKHEDETIGPFKMYVSNMTVGSMRHPGDFICVSGPYADMQFVKDQLKALGLRFDGMGKQWYVYWTKCDWNKIKNVVRDVLSDFVWRKTKRSPMIMPIIMEIE